MWFSGGVFVFAIRIALRGTRGRQRAPGGMSMRGDRPCSSFDEGRCGDGDDGEEGANVRVCGARRKRGDIKHLGIVECWSWWRERGWQTLTLANQRPPLRYAGLTRPQGPRSRTTPSHVMH
ncbi:hypothetical protein MRB53_041986 [Persea americana]|nr:hypothetical protein MRB53_041986 [Persea americana]